jgi:molybdenum cofactor cytidylyltransferase
MSAVGAGGGVILLAAGRGRRFGSDKRRHVLPEGDSLLARSVRLYSAAFPDAVVVLRPDDADPAELIAPRSAPLHGDRASVGPRFVRAADADLGMGHSLAAGARAAPDWTYLFVALADMAWVAPATLLQLRGTMERALVEGRADTIVQPVHAGMPGHPVGFAARYREELYELRGDEGARSVIRRHAARVERVEVADPGVLRDLDTPEPA